MSRVNICQEDLVLVLVDFSKFRLVRWLVDFFQLLSTMILPFLLLLLLSLLDLAFVDAFIYRGDASKLKLVDVSILCAQNPLKIAPV